jgi:hypothetical protein
MIPIAGPHALPYNGRNELFTYAALCRKPSWGDSRSRSRCDFCVEQKEHSNRLTPCEEDALAVKLTKEGCVIFSHGGSKRQMRYLGGNHNKSREDG